MEEQGCVMDDVGRRMENEGWDMKDGGDRTKDKG